MTARPRVGVSRCLVGDEVRYDGTHRLDETVIALLGPYVEWVPVCPEVEIGMGTPREPIQLVTSPDGVRSLGERVRLVGVTSGQDWTERMHAWARDRARELAALDLSGYVFKARSPSCGIDHVVVHAVDGERQAARAVCPGADRRAARSAGDRRSVAGGPGVEGPFSRPCPPASRRTVGSTHLSIDDR